MKNTLLAFIVTIITAYTAYATIDDTQGLYRAPMPYFTLGSGYYLNRGTNYYWQTNKWIFDTGYAIPACRCNTCINKNIQSRCGCAVRKVR